MQIDPFTGQPVMNQPVMNRGRFLLFYGEHVVGCSDLEGSCALLCS